MTKVNRVQSVITEEELSELAKEAGYQKRTISSLIRKYIVDGAKKDRVSRERESVDLIVGLPDYR